MTVEQSALAEVDASDGRFKRTESTFRDSVSSEPGAKFAPEAGRYVLVVSLACPWASRCLVALHQKGLEDAVALSVVHPTWQRSRPDDANDKHCGWAFVSPDHAPLKNAEGYGSFPCKNCTPLPAPLDNVKFVRDLYDKAGYSGKKYTVPVLWDLQHGTIVNNESQDIVRMFNTQFQALAKHPDVDLYPESLRAKIDEVNGWVYTDINDGVYKCGFAQQQAAYEDAFHALFKALDKVEGMLGESRFLMGDQLTEADIRLFKTLIRFDEVYVVYFKTNQKRISDYPNLRGYVQDLYSMPAFAKSVDMYHIKTHYYTSHPVLNAYAIVPVGGEAWWTHPSNRDKQFAS